MTTFLCLLLIMINLNTTQALTLCGMRESAGIAFAIWVVHIVTLTVLAVGCLAYAASDGWVCRSACFRFICFQSRRWTHE